MRVIAVVLCLCVVCAAASEGPDSKAAAINHRKPPGHSGPPQVFKISAFKDVTAYVLTVTQQRLKGGGVRSNAVWTWLGIWGLPTQCTQRAEDAANGGFCGLMQL